MMPEAACTQASAVKLSNAGAKPEIKRSMGNCSPITPVENGKTSLAFTCATLANSAQVFCAFCMPKGPVPALALPVLMTK